MDESGFLSRLHQRIVPSGTVLERAVRSGAWEGGLNTINRLIQLAKVAILARLLPPTEFGILGIGFLVLAIVTHFSRLGINEALIQRAEADINEFLDTAWVLQICRGLLLAGTVFVVAPFAASVFGVPRATNVIRTLGLGPLLLGFKNPGIVYFRKNLQFHRRFVQILSGTITNFVVAVTLGVLLGNVWALVAGSVVGNVTSLLVSYLLHGYRPRLYIDIDRARELIDYGQWIFGQSITTFLTNQGDDVFVGWFLGATPLAFYQMGYRFSNAPATELTAVITSVTFPSLSRVQNDSEKLRRGFFRTLRVSTFVSFPAAVGIAVVAPTFVRALLGVEWLATVPVMQALAVWGAFRTLDTAVGPVFNTLSRPDIGTKFGSIRVVLIALTIYPAANLFGLLGVAFVIVASAAVVTPLLAYVTLGLMNESFARYLRTLVHPTVGSLAMGVIVWTAQAHMIVESQLLELVFLIGLGVVTYAAYIIAATRLAGYPIESELRTIVKVM